MSSNVATQVRDAVTKPVPPPSTCKLLGSVRLTYTICAFLAMLLNTWLRNTMNFVVLCMSHSNQIPKVTESMFSNASLTTACGAIAEELQTSESTMQMSGDLDWSRSEQFLMLSSIYIGSLLIAPFAGHWSDNYGGKMFFVNGIVLQAIVFMASPLMIRLHYIAGFIMRILQGVLAGLSSPAVYILFSVWSHPSERTALMSFAYGGFSVGSILAYPISGQLCRFGWENTFYAVGMIVLLISVPFYWLVYSTLDEHPRIKPLEYAYLHSGSVESKHPKVPWRNLLTSVPVYSFTLTHVLHSYIITVITLTLPKMLKDTMSFSLTEISFYSMFPFLGCVLSKVVTLTLISRIEHHFKLQLTKFRRILYALTNSAINLCVCSLIWLTCQQREIVVFIYMAVGFFSDVGFSGAYWPSMLYVAPLFAGLIAGIANCFSTLTGVITPVITAAIVKNGTKEEWNFILYSILFANSLALLIYGCWGSSELQPWGKVNLTNEETRKSSLKKGEISSEIKKVCFVNECFDTKL